MEWYAPLTVLPAIGLLILSTSNFIIALTEELTALEKENQPERAIIISKLGQLRRLGIANVGLYSGAFLFMIAGISQAAFASDFLFFTLMLAGVLFSTVSLVFLLIHSIMSVRIRQRHLMVEKD